MFTTHANLDTFLVPSLSVTTVMSVIMSNVVHEMHYTP